VAYRLLQMGGPLENKQRAPLEDKHYRAVANDKHYRAVRALFKETFDTTIFTPHTLNETWYTRHKDESYAFFDSDKLIGFILTSYHRKNKENMYIDFIAIDKAYRGKGLGSKYLSEMLSKLKEQRRSVHLYPERRELNGWYERLGFYKTHDGYYNFHSYDTRLKLC